MSIIFVNHKEAPVASSPDKFDDTVIGANAQGVIRQQEGSDVKVVEVTLKHSEVEDGGDGKLVLLTLTRGAARELWRAVNDAVAWLDGQGTPPPSTPTEEAPWDGKRQAWTNDDSDHYIQVTGDPDDGHVKCLQRVTPGSGLPGTPYGEHLRQELWVSEQKLRKNGRF